jgi:hypothetical protein
MPEYTWWVKHGEEEEVNVTDEAIENNNNDQDQEGWNKDADPEHDGTEDDDGEETEDEMDTQPESSLLASLMVHDRKVQDILRKKTTIERVASREIPKLA